MNIEEAVEVGMREERRNEKIRFVFRIFGDV